MDEFFFTPSDDEARDRKVRRWHENGKLTKVSTGIYVRPTAEPIEAIVIRNWPKIVGRLVPNGVVTDRSGIEARPTRRNNSDENRGAQIFMSAPRARDVIQVPGLDINVREGAGQAEGDIPYLGTYLAGAERKLLDNLAPSRSRGGEPPRTLGATEVEKRLDQICRVQGEDHLNAIRDRARKLAPLIGREKEFAVLNNLISALLRTHQVKLATVEGNARQQGSPLDIACVDRLVLLAGYLQERAPFIIANNGVTRARVMSGAFMEAYFSNYIEGTEFLIGEATEIVFDGVLPQDRPEDGHDILGTYLQLVESGGRAPSAATYPEFIDELKLRHFRLMENRPKIKPGTFKEKPNKASDTVFVQPDLIEGTIREGLKILTSLRDGFQRAVFLHYLLSEVHPFNDGNGRISRIMMSRELIAAGLSRIVIPTVFRDDYVSSLRALSRRNDPSIFVRSLEFCQRVSAACSAETTDEAIILWAKSFAFCENARQARLTMPNAALEIVEHNGVYAPVIYWEALETEPAKGFGF